MIAHWDDVESFHVERAPMGLTVQRLGDAAGTKEIGVNRVRIDPGRLSTPPHSHAASEEIFFVVSGSGLLWQDEHVCAVREGDTIVHLADREEHTIRAGPEGLEYIVFGTRHPVEYGWLPRSRAMRFGYLWIEGRNDNRGRSRRRSASSSSRSPASGRRTWSRSTTSSSTRTATRRSPTRRAPRRAD